MRTVESFLMCHEKINEFVTHYITTPQQTEAVQVDPNSLSLNVQDETGNRIVTVMHPGSFSQQQLCRQVVVNNDGQITESVSTWSEELLNGSGIGTNAITSELIEEDGNLAAALVAVHLANKQQPQLLHEINNITKQVTSVRSDVEHHVMMDGNLRLFNTQNMNDHNDPIVVEVPNLSSLPPLTHMKRVDPNWFHKEKNEMKDEQHILEAEHQSIELAGSSPAQTKQNKKSLPHKKRISRKLKRGSATPQQDIVVINYGHEHEQILPDTFVSQGESQQLTQVRPIFLCQLCGDFFGEDQLKFYHHLKEHYEPHNTTIIIENPVNQMNQANQMTMDKINGTCIVDNVGTSLPESLVELSLEQAVNKQHNMYHTNDKHLIYSDKSNLYSISKCQYTTANMEKVVYTPDDKEVGEMYDGLDKEAVIYSCPRCSRNFRNKKQCEMHYKDEHKMEEMNEFSEPEDLMEGINVMVDADEYETRDHMHRDVNARNPDEGTHLLHHLTVDNSEIHNTTMKQWKDGNTCSVCGLSKTFHHTNCTFSLKEEVLQRILDSEVENFENAQINESVMPEPNEMQSTQQSSETLEQKKTDQDIDTTKLSGGKKKKHKKNKLFCDECDKVFYHKSSYVYHKVSHSGNKAHKCDECGKSFYTLNALKVHCRLHSGDKPYKCKHCQRQFRQWGDLNYHIVSIHSNEKQHKCEFCEKEFARKYSLNLHRRIHTGEKNYKCEFCNKSFRCSSYKLTHMKIHTGEKPFKCDECGKSFRCRSDLRRHKLIHEKHRNTAEKLKPKAKAVKKIVKEIEANTEAKSSDNNVKLEVEHESKLTQDTEQVNNGVFKMSWQLYNGL